MVKPPTPPNRKANCQISVVVTPPENKLFLEALDIAKQKLVGDPKYEGDIAYVTKRDAFMQIVDEFLQISRQCIN